MTDIRRWRILDVQFVETEVFGRQVNALLTDGEYRNFQMYLSQRPDAGAVIPGSGGLRKLRWGLPGRGKRGGARVIYYWRTATGVILLLYLYRKSGQSDVSQAELHMLRKVVDKHLAGA